MFDPGQPEVLSPDQIIHWLKGVFEGVAIAAAVIVTIMDLFIRRKEKSAPKAPQTKASEVIVNTEATSTPK